MRKILSLVAALALGCASTPRGAGVYVSATSITASAEAADDASVRYDAVLPLYEVNQMSMSFLQAAMEELTAAGATDFLLLIDSPGGEVFSGLEFIKFMERLEKQGVRTHCVVDGMAASMGFVILQACSSRLMTTRSVLMAHEPSMTTRGTAKEIEESVKLLKVVAEMLVMYATSKLHITPAEYRERVDGKDWWMPWNEALEVGAIEGFVHPSQIPLLDGQKIEPIDPTQP